MKRFLFAIALAFSFLSLGAEPNIPANAPMPVLYQAVNQGPTYPVLAKKGDQYFQVFVYAKGQPYFTDAEGKWHFVSSTTTAESFPIYYVSGQSSQPLAVPQGKSDEQVRDTLLTGNGHGDAADHLVCWGSYGWYGYDYTYYNNYNYYPSYSYGYGYNGGAYYGGYSNGYYGNGYGCYGYGQPYYYSGYGCVMNNWYY